MKIASLILNLFALFSVAGAVTVLTILVIKLKRRELLLLIVLIASIALNYGTAILLMATLFPDAIDPATGYIRMMQEAPRIYTLIIIFSHALSVLASFLLPSALLQRRPPRLFRILLTLLSLFFLYFLITGLFLPSVYHQILPVYFQSAIIIYFFALGYASCRPLFTSAQLPRPLGGLIRKALLVFACGIFPLMILEDLLSFLGLIGKYGFTDALAYFYLTTSIIALSLLFLLKQSRPVSPEETQDRFAAQFSLSPREREILTGLLKGLSYKELAAELSVSPETVKSHASSLYRKTGTKNRSDLAGLFHKNS